jgi:phosphatidylserine/phosphatidylglycerophosphate/cardiolipin synthase-like enzyme
VTIEHPGIAGAYERHLDYDRAHGKDAPSELEPPDLLVSAEPKPDFAERKRYPPLQVQRKVRVTPLLTPDNFADRVLPFIESAKTSLYLQNQYVKLNPDGDFPEFRALVGALLDRIRAGVDVRIVLRDSMPPDKLELLFALGFPAKVFRRMKGYHAKLIVDKISAKIARDIAKKIENEMQYPGEIKVTLIREVRSVEYAR